MSIFSANPTIAEEFWIYVVFSYDEKMKDLLSTLKDVEKKEILESKNSNNGMTPLLYSIGMQNPERTQFLIDAGADIRAVDYEGNNILHLMAGMTKPHAIMGQRHQTKHTYFTDFFKANEQQISRFERDLFLNQNALGQNFLDIYLTKQTSLYSLVSFVKKHENIEVLKSYQATVRKLKESKTTGSTPIILLDDEYKKFLHEINKRVPILEERQQISSILSVDNNNAGLSMKKISKI